MGPKQRMSLGYAVASFSPRLSRPEKEEARGVGRADKKTKGAIMKENVFGDFEIFPKKNFAKFI
jgi:hypothetical protein